MWLQPMTRLELGSKNTTPPALQSRAHLSIDRTEVTKDSQYQNHASQQDSKRRTGHTDKQCDIDAHCELHTPHAVCWLIRLTGCDWRETPMFEIWQHPQQARVAGFNPTMQQSDLRQHSTLIDKVHLPFTNQPSHFSQCPLRPLLTFKLKI